jgi:Tfp pilus assembly protein PilF
MMTIDEGLEVAIAAVQQDDLGRARAVLTQILQHDPRNATAWLWMAACVPDEKAKRDCYRRAEAASHQR